MSELSEEEIARAILHEEYGLEPGDAPNLYGKALSTARLVMALLQPALERARREGYDLNRAARMMQRIHWASGSEEQIEATLAAAIRKG